MRTPARLASLVVLLLALVPSVATARARHRLPPRQTVPASAIRVHDGDTFYVGPEKIRLLGIDTPELGAPRSRMAALRLIQLLGEGPVTIVPRAEDVYGRVVADVYVRGHDVSRILRREGFAKFRR